MCDACNSVNRRQFLATGGAATAAGAMLLGALRNRPLSAATTDEGWPAMEPVKIFTVYSG